MPCTDAANWDATGPPPSERKLLTITCAVLSVPRDHAHPDRGTLLVRVLRVRSTHQHDRIGSLVLNPGGPGVSGLEAMPGWTASLPGELLARFDLVTFDPRGVGASAPLRCPTESRHQALGDALRSPDLDAAQARQAADDRACAAVIAASGASYGTDAVARDLDLLRQAMGDARLTYVGWSYGARLGAHYAHLYPDRVRALVLDGPPHPTASWTELVDSTLDGFEAAWASYVSSCPRRDSCAQLGADPGAALSRLLTRARTQPIPSGRPAGDPPATWDVVLRSVLGFLATPELWPALDSALAEADEGDAGSLYDMVDSLEGRSPTRPQADDSTARNAIQCTDTPPAPDAAVLRSAAVRAAQDHHTFGAYGAWWMFACATWAAPRTPLPTPSSSTTAPILVVGGTADPSTPLGGARAVTSAIGPAATLLTSAAPGHTSFGRSPCIAEHVVRLLTRLVRPPTGVTCP